MHTSALIGCGRIGFLLEDDPLRYKPCTHAGGASGARIPFTHACDIDAARLKLFGERYGISEKNQYSDFRDLLNSVRPELVTIATWTESHFTIAKEASKNGARVVILEKPVTGNLSDAKSLITACKKNGTALIVNHERRYDSRYLKAREIISKGEIGELRSINAMIMTAGRFGLAEEKQGGGPLLHDGTHLIDIIRFFAGDIVSIDGRFERYGKQRGFENRASASMRTGQGVDVFCQAGGASRYFHFELDLIGTEGRLIIGNGINRLYQTRKSRLYRGFSDLRETGFPAHKNKNCFTSLYREARALLEGKSETISSSGMDGYRALEIIHAVYLSAHRNQRIFLPIKPSDIDLKKIFNL